MKRGYKKIAKGRPPPETPQLGCDSSARSSHFYKVLLPLLVSFFPYFVSFFPYLYLPSLTYILLPLFSTKSLIVSLVPISALIFQT